jgi:hypothetical protein
LLRGTDWYDVSMNAGGSLTANVNGYFDNSDPDFLVRWKITDNPTRNDTKMIVVRAIALGQATPLGQRKQVTVATLRGRT